MEENTMSKNDAEESRSVSEGVERSTGSGQEQEDAKKDSNSAGQSEAERRTVRSRSAQSGSRTSQTSVGSTRAAGSRRNSQAGAAPVTRTRRVSQESGEEQAGIRRVSRATGEEQTGTRRVSRDSGEEQTGTRRVSRESGEEQTGTRRVSRDSGEEQTGTRRVGRAAGEEQTGTRRVGRAAGEEQTGTRRVGRAAGEEQAAARRVSRESGEERSETRHVSRESGEERSAARRASQSAERERAASRRSAGVDERLKVGTVQPEQRSSRQARARAAARKEEIRIMEREMRSAKFGLGHKKTRRSAIAYFFDDIAEAFVRAKNWCVRNYRMSIPAAICVVLVIVVACILVRNFRMQPTPVSENTDALAGEYPLEQDAYEYVNSFFQRYYEASTYGDVETYASMRSYTDMTERIRMQKKANYIDYYQNLSCYTKPGPVENSYLVYVYYEVKFRGINTVAPGLKSFYLCTNDAGELYVFSGDVDQNVIDYMRTASTQEDVKDLFNRVKVMYNNAVASDKELKDFLATLADNLLTEVELALMEQEALSQNDADGDEGGEAAEPDSEPEQPEPTPEAEPEPETEPQTDKVMTTERVNVRSSASPEATKLGTVAAGTQFTRYETLENGWSKIDYEGSEAYIKTEFLQVVEAAVGKVNTVESVNIRASASEDATKLGTVSAGTTLDLIEIQENGWSRILFNGSTAYVKTEFLDTANITQ